jgi:diacylglycerol O-acyltransferase / wax synthase
MMAERLNALDAIYLYGENATTPSTAAALVVLDQATLPHGPLTLAEAIRTIERRIPQFPRLRQKVAFVPFEVARPVWVDDTEFDPRYHLRPVVLDEPGGRAELVELVEQVHRGPLERSRPLWELYVVQGLEADRMALVFKWHHAMADGLSAIDIMCALFYGHKPRRLDPAAHTAQPEPSPLGLLADAVADQARQVRRAAQACRSLPSDPGALLQRVGTLAGGARSIATLGPPEPSPLNVPVGRDRRFAMTAFPVGSVRQVANALGTGVNEVALAPIAAALGRLLDRRGFETDGRFQRAMIPISTRSHLDRRTLGNLGAYLLVDLPVGPMDEVTRLHEITRRFAAARSSGQDELVAALIRAGDWLPPSWQALVGKVDRRNIPGFVNLVISYVRGPHRPLDLAGARHLATYPVPPIADGLALTVAIVSMGGAVAFGFLADWAAVPDVERVAEDVTAAFADLQRRTRQAAGAVRTPTR